MNLTPLVEHGLLVTQNHERAQEDARRVPLRGRVHTAGLFPPGAFPPGLEAPELVPLGLFRTPLRAPGLG